MKEAIAEGPNDFDRQDSGEDDEAGNVDVEQDREETESRTPGSINKEKKFQNLEIGKL